MENYVVPEHLAMRKQPSQVRTRRLVEHILDTTLWLIQDQGMAAVNTNLIARYAEIDIASLYRFFKNKEAIFFALAHRWFLKVQHIVEQEDIQQRVGSSIIEYRNSTQVKLRGLPETEVMLVSFHELFTHDKDFRELEFWHRSIVVEQMKRTFIANGCQWDEQALTSACIYMYCNTRNFMAGTLGMSEEEHLQQFAWFQVSLNQLRGLVLRGEVPEHFIE